MFDPIILLGAAAAVTVCGAMGSVALSCFRKCGPNQAMIVSGMMSSESGQGGAKIIIGPGGTIILPVIQQMAIISLQVMTMEIMAKTPYETCDKWLFNLTLSAQIRIDSTEAAVRAASETILDKNDAEICDIAKTIIVGHLRSVIGEMKSDDVVANLSKVCANVEQRCLADFTNYGLKTVSLQVIEHVRFERDRVPSLHRAEQANS